MRWLSLLLVGLLAGCTDAPEPFLGDLPPMDVQSLAYLDGKAIPERYTCDGDGISIPLSWQVVPNGTTHFAMIFEDPDADGTFVHWIWWDLVMPNQGIASGDDVTRGGAVEGRNSAGGIGYTPPCPPEGETHRYYATVFALDGPLGLPSGSTVQELRAALELRATAKGSLFGTYAR
ncbi:MAG: YbhB/YbcL family Raf kinase inhibitor-like protein [Thermoplasmatota archaeon]